MRDRIITIPKIERKLSSEDQVMRIIDNIALPADVIVKKMKGRSSNIRGLLSNMVRDGRLKIVICSHCEIGRMYQVKK